MTVDRDTSACPCSDPQNCNEVRAWGEETHGYRCQFLRSKHCSAFPNGPLSRAQVIEIALSAAAYLGHRPPTEQDLEQIVATHRSLFVETQNRRELRGCCSCPQEWLDDGDNGRCPFCGHPETEIRTSFFAEPPSATK